MLPSPILCGGSIGDPGASLSPTTPFNTRPIVASSPTLCVASTCGNPCMPHSVLCRPHTYVLYSTSPLPRLGMNVPSLHFSRVCTPFLSTQTLSLPLASFLSRLMDFVLPFTFFVSPQFSSTSSMQGNDGSFSPSQPITLCKSITHLMDLMGEVLHPLWLQPPTRWNNNLKGAQLGITHEYSESRKNFALVQSLLVVSSKFVGLVVVVGICIMPKRSVGSVHWRRNPRNDEHSYLVNSVQALQIQVNNLSLQVLTSLEILVEHR